MVEKYTGNTSVPAYVKEHPTGGHNIFAILFNPSPPCLPHKFLFFAAGKFLLAMGLTDMLEFVRLPALIAAMPWLRAKLAKKSIKS